MMPEMYLRPGIAIGERGGFTSRAIARANLARYRSSSSYGPAEAERLLRHQAPVPGARSAAGRGARARGQRADAARAAHLRRDLPRGDLRAGGDAHQSGAQPAGADRG